MARVAVIAAALARVVWRDVRSLGSLAGNNFFFFLLLVLFQQPESGLFLAVLLTLPLLLLVSGDVMGKIPRDRLALWPLTDRETFALRVVSLGLNPLVWLAAGLSLLKRQGGWGALLIGLLVVSQALAAVWRPLAGRLSGLGSWGSVLPTGSGWLSALVLKNLRQLLSTLDPYPLLLLSAGATVYRVAAKAPEASAFPVISVMLALGLSTFAQSLFGLDGRSGLDRYRLLPLPGWRILLGKDLALLAVLIILVLPLRPDVGTAAGLAALAIGHHSSVLRPAGQKRWRFTSGQIWPIGLIQIVGTIGAGMAVAQTKVWGLLAGGVYVVSLFFYGRVWDRSK